MVCSPTQSCLISCSTTSSLLRTPLHCSSLQQTLSHSSLARVDHFGRPPPSRVDHFGRESAQIYGPHATKLVLTRGQATREEAARGQATREEAARGRPRGCHIACWGCGARCSASATIRFCIPENTGSPGCSAPSSPRGWLVKSPWSWVLCRASVVPSPVCCGVVLLHPVSRVGALRACPPPTAPCVDHFGAVRTTIFRTLTCTRVRIGTLPPQQDPQQTSPNTKSVSTTHS